jgi:hypothetical protein
MPSRIWELDPSEAYERPYEYRVQAQFMRELTALLPRLYALLNSEENRTVRDDQSPRQAVWLLQMEALDCLRESAIALDSKRHRVASALVRTTHEVLDLARYFCFAGETSEGSRRLQGWYRDEIIEHRVFRRWVEEIEGPESAKRKAAMYQELSRFTHRSYRTLLRGYSLGQGERLVHDATTVARDATSSSETFLVVPETISVALAILAQSSLRIVAELERCEMVEESALAEAIRESLESHSESWCFTTPREIYERYIASRD